MESTARNCAPSATDRSARRVIGPRARVGADAAGPAILTLCGMVRRKGVAELIDAFATIAERRPDARLYLAGDGPDRAEFEGRRPACPARRGSPSSASFPNRRPLLAQADVFVLASRNEPFGLVLAEAREAGCAIVATAVGGVPEVLEHGRAGVLVAPGDVAALAAALDRLSRTARRAPT